MGGPVLLRREGRDFGCTERDTLCSLSRTIQGPRWQRSNRRLNSIPTGRTGRAGHRQPFTRRRLSLSWRSRWLAQNCVFSRERSVRRASGQPAGLLLQSRWEASTGRKDWFRLSLRGIAAPFGASELAAVGISQSQLISEEENFMEIDSVP